MGTQSRKTILHHAGNRTTHPPLIGGMIATSSPDLSIHESSKYSWLIASVHASRTLAIWGCCSTTSFSRAPVSLPDTNSSVRSSVENSRVLHAYVFRSVRTLRQVELLAGESSDLASFCKV